MRDIIKTSTILLALILASLFLFSCSGDMEGGDISVAEKRDAESRHAIEQFGEVLSVIALEDQSSARSKGYDEETKDVNPDEDGIESVFYLVAYKSINPVWLEHINTEPKQSFHIPALEESSIDLNSNFLVVFRSCYIAGEDNEASPVKREIYLLDKESVQNNGDVLLQSITSSPDFTIDIHNEIEIKTGLPKKYNWITGKVEEADQFIEDNETDFSKLFDKDDPPQIKAWKFVKPDGTPVTATHSSATYILEVDKKSVKQFFGFELGSIISEKNLRIKNFIIDDIDRDNKAYLEISRYPEGYIHTWEARCYWHDKGEWRYTYTIQTDEDLELIWYKDIKQESLATFFDEAKRIGNITRIYQAYKGNDPLEEEGTYYTYVVEFDSLNDGYEKLLSAITNSQGKTHKTTSSLAGSLQKNTVAYAYFNQRIDDPSDLIVVIHVYCESEGNWYTSYRYLPISVVGGRLAINSKFVDDGKNIYYDYEAGKNKAKSRYDGSLYYCEYEGPYSLENTLVQLGKINRICYYTGDTGQTTPFIQSFSYNSGTLVSAVAQFSSFNQEKLEELSTETRPQNPSFTNDYQSYDMDYDNDSLWFAELDVFFNAEGTATEVQVRKVTNVAGFETKEYATTYVMNPGFLLENLLS